MVSHAADSAAQVTLTGVGGVAMVLTAQVRARLHERFVTTDEQVVAIARRTAGLEVFGPNLIRIAP